MVGLCQIISLGKALRISNTHTQPYGANGRAKRLWLIKYDLTIWVQNLSSMDPTEERHQTTMAYTGGKEHTHVSFSKA